MDRWLAGTTAPTLSRKEIEQRREARAALREERDHPAEPPVPVDYTGNRGQGSIYDLESRPRPQARRSPGGGAQLGVASDNLPFPGSEKSWAGQVAERDEVEFDVEAALAAFHQMKAEKAAPVFDQSIGDLAAVFGRSVRVIKAWEHDGWLPRATRRSAGGHRRYSARQLDGLAEISAALGIKEANRMSPEMIELLKYMSHELFGHLSDKAPGR